jgi:hypothetical protein
MGNVTHSSNSSPTSGKNRSSSNTKRLKPGKEGAEALSPVKNKDDSHGMMKVEQRWIEKFYR